MIVPLFELNLLRGLANVVTALRLLSHGAGIAGAKDMQTGMIYTHVLSRGGKCVQSPLGILQSVPLPMRPGGPPDCKFLRGFCTLCGAIAF